MLLSLWLVLCGTNVNGNSCQSSNIFEMIRKHVSPHIYCRTLNASVCVIALCSERATVKLSRRGECLNTTGMSNEGGESYVESGYIICNIRFTLIWCTQGAKNLARMGMFMYA